MLMDELKMQAIAVIIIGMLMIVVMVLMYFLPTFIAFAAKRKNKAAIFILNLLLGWTFIGWVAALVWAMIKE